MRKRRFYRRWGFWVTLLLLGLIAAGSAWVAADYYTRPYRERAATYDLNQIDDLEVPSVILDRNGDEIGRIFVENRSIIPFSEIPERMIGALKSGEDRRFDLHDGIDYMGVVRAAYLNWKAKEVNQGASTITQQLARNAFNLRDEAKSRREGPYERKLVEAFLSQRIEERYEKWQILEFYLNRIYFGSGFYGVRSAALGYFGKEPRDLTVLECAALVGLIKRPNYLSPLNNPEASRKARNMVLLRMLEDGRITKDQLKVWTKQPVRLNPRPLQRGTNHVYERVAEEMRTRLGEESLSEGGYRIHTTIDKSVQEAAEEALRRSLARAEARPGYAHQRMDEYDRASGLPPEYLQGAMLMVDHTTGEVLAHVGGRNYGDASFDFASLGRRPAGTAFFPFIYAAGFEAGLTPATVVEDEAMDNRSVMIGGRVGILGEWGMETDRPNYEGEITARRALEQSKIAATVRFGHQVGIEKVIEAGRRFGFPFAETELLPRLLVGWEEVSLSEVVAAYAAFGRGGELGPQRLAYVDRIEDSAGEVRYRRSVAPPKHSRATDPATAFQVHSMLQGTIERGNAVAAAGELLQRPFPGGGKGGSTHDFSDCWFGGYNSRISCAVWVGFLQGAGKPIYEGAFSKDLAMPVWVAAMNAARPAFGGEGLKPPQDLAEVPICRVSGQKATGYCYETVEDPETGTPMTRPTTYSEWLRAGSQAIPFCSVHAGGGMTAVGEDGAPVLDQQAINAIPIRPTAPVLLGDDPYNSEAVAMVGDETAGSGGRPFRRRNRMLESLELGDKDSEIILSRPRRLQIFSE